MSLKLPNKPIPFWIRVSLSSLLPWSVSMFFIVVFLLDLNMLGLWVGIGFFIIFTIRHGYWGKFYLLNYEVVEDQIIFYYQRFDKKLSTQIKIDDLKLKWRPLPTREKRWQLKFYSSNQFRFSQTNFGYWNLTNITELLDKLYSDIDKEPSLETKMTLDWWK